MTIPHLPHCEESCPASHRPQQVAFASLARADGLAALLALAGTTQHKQAALDVGDRGDSGLSEAATERGCESPIPSSQKPAPAADGSDARKVRSVHREDILEGFHVDARLREVRRPRGQKMQSSID